jgi:hypothetical protein
MARCRCGQAHRWPVAVWKDLGAAWYRRGVGRCFGRSRFRVSAKARRISRHLASAFRLTATVPSTGNF